MPVLPSREQRLLYGQFNTIRTTGPRTLQLAGNGRTGLGPTAISLEWSTPAAAQTLTIPDAGGDDTFVMLAATQTLTNKTFTSPTLTTPTMSNPRIGGVMALPVGGSATAPVLAFTGDLNTGIYRVGADNIAYSAGGVAITQTTTAFSPITTDTVALGTTALMWSDLFVDSGAVLNFAAGNVTVTHSTLALTLASAAVASVGTSPGTNAGTLLTITGAVGGATSIATTGTAGNGAGIALTTGAGGVATAATTAATGGNGGSYAIITGAGGAEAVAGAGNSVGGNGGLYSITGGNGGAVSVSTGTNLGGNGGGITLTTGTGGAAAATAGTDTGGVGGTLNLIAGPGGNGAETGGAGGAINITAGNGGTGGNVAAGSIAILPGTATGTGAAGSVTVGRAGVGANGGGVRTAASRVILANKPTAAVDASSGITATVAEIFEAGIFTSTQTASITLPTAAGSTGIVQGMPGTPAVGDIIEIVVACSHATQVVTLVAGTGSTLFGLATTAPGGGNRIWRGRVTSITGGSETITWY